MQFQPGKEHQDDYFFADLNGPGRITFQAIAEQKQMGLPGNILMDAPHHNTLWDLVFLAKDRVYNNPRLLNIPDYIFLNLINYARKISDSEYLLILFVFTNRRFSIQLASPIR